MKSNRSEPSKAQPDLEALQQLKDQLQHSEEHFRHLFDMAPLGYQSLNEDGYFVDVNQAWCETLGYPKEAVIGRWFGDFLVPEYIESFRHCFSQFKQQGSIHSEFEMQHHNGERRYIAFEGRISYSPDGRIERTHCILQDITDRKKTESALKESEETIRLLFNSTAEGIYGIDTNGHCIFCNKAALTRLGYANEQEVLGKNMHQLIHHSHKNGKVIPEKKCRIFKAFIEEKGSHCDQEVFWTKKGTSFPVEYWSYPIFRENKIIGSVVTFVDITQKQQLNEALVNSESKYRYLFENNPAPMWIYDEVTLAFLEVNEAAIEHYGYTREEFLQLTIKDIRPLEDVDRLMKDVDETFRPLNQAGTWRHIKKSGEIIYVDIVSHLIDYESKRARLVISTDITERIEMEKDLVRAKEKAEESDRLKSAFLANMSHEIRTPMNSILGFSELLKDPQFDDKQKETFIQIITTNGNSLLNIINDIIDISKIEAGEMRLQKAVVDVDQVMESLKNQYSFQEVNPSVTFRWPKPQVTNCVSVLADKERMFQVFNNLISNALKFTDEGYIEVSYQPADEQVTFYVKDTGIGIDPEYHTLIFKRFRQVEAGTSRVFGGNGLGLAICKHLVGLMGGTLWVDSEKGKGATFYFTLPLA